MPTLIGLLRTRRQACGTLFVLPAALVLAWARSSAGDCPASELSFGPGSVFTSSAAVFDSSVIYSGDSGARAAYDLPAGTVEVLHCCGLGVGYARARDEFDVVGVPAGTRVAAVAEMAVEGWIISLGCSPSGCWGYLDAGITSGPSTSQITLAEELLPAGRLPVSGSVQLPVTLVAGQPEIIEFALSARRAAGGNNGAEGIGRIQFTGLPAGARVVSCNGYGNVATPARRRSWGQIKTIYR